MNGVIILNVASYWKLEQSTVLKPTKVDMLM